MCGEGACVMPCVAGMTLCEGVCVDAKFDKNHCGGCGKPCAGALLCGDGVCSDSCPAGRVDCDGSCIDLLNDAANCGGCGLPCESHEACKGGSCVAECSVGELLCPGGVCADPSTDEQNCGSCGKICGNGQVCQGGFCGEPCAPPKEPCSGVCLDTQSNGQNCGGCGKVCGDGFVCLKGQCKLSCPSGQEDCGGACVDPKSDPAHCGGCDKPCKGVELCSDGQCSLTCPPGQTNCDGACIDTSSSDAHCGGCNKPCKATEACGGGTCALTCAGQLTGTVVADQWGVSWDGKARPSTTHVQATTTCAAIGGRLPTATELHRVSAARTAQVGKPEDTGNLWTIVPYDDDEQVVARLSDGNVSKRTVSLNSTYRCVCAPPAAPGFSGSDCTGNSGPECVPFERDGRTYNLDARDRAPLSASGAAWECAFQGGHLPDAGTLAAAVRAGLPGGGAAAHWTADPASLSAGVTLVWQDNQTWAASASTLGQSALTTANSISFRCIGPDSAPKVHPGAPAGAFVVKATQVAYDAADRAAKTWILAHDACTGAGGHLAPPVDLMEAVFAGISAGSGAKLWTADQAGYNGTQFLAATVQWTAAEPRSGWFGKDAASWAYMDLSLAFRCAYYPTSDAYPGPDAAQCTGSCFKVPAPASAPKPKLASWFDAADRGSAAIADAIADCHKAGGRLPRERDYAEAIRAGLPSGTNKWLFTSDFSVSTTDAISRAHTVRWTLQEPAFADVHTADASWSDLTIKRPYRCMWTSEAR